MNTQMGIRVYNMCAAVTIQTRLHVCRTDRKKTLWSQTYSYFSGDTGPGSIFLVGLGKNPG